MQFYLFIFLDVLNDFFGLYLRLYMMKQFYWLQWIIIEVIIRMVDRVWNMEKWVENFFGIQVFYVLWIEFLFLSFLNWLVMIDYVGVVILQIVE